jgi:hypothetical protein
VVVDDIRDSARAENACARRLAAIAELYERRQIPAEDGQGRELWRIDPWEAVAAEVAAAQVVVITTWSRPLLVPALCVPDWRITAEPNRNQRSNARDITTR